MTELYKNKYRLPSSRLQNFNYGSEAMYFVTICTKYMQHFFGKIEIDPQTQVAKLGATEIGKIAKSEWYKSLELRPDMNLDIGEFIVMPNHIHGIIIIGENIYNSAGMNSDYHRDSELNRNSELNRDSELQRGTDAMHRISTQSASASAFAPQSKNLASIIRGYKSAVTTYARKNNIKFEWHVRYHDHIIRNEQDYLRISNYIKNNPSKWFEDKFNNLK